MGRGMVALAERAIACEGWRWMPGMRNKRGFLRGFSGWLAVDDGWCELDTYPPHLPDLSDPATLGCLLALVRSAYGDPWIRIEPMSSGWVCIYSKPPPGFPANGDTEAEALVAALECAP